MRKRQVAGRQDALDQQEAVDAGMELRFSTQPGQTFVPGGAYHIPAEVVSGVRHMLTRMLTSEQWPQTVALTAALREEGVTTTALALAAVLAMDTSRSVCLVDTNWYWPALPVVDSPGLAAVLEGKVSIEDALIQVHGSTGVDEWRGGEGGLAVLPAGRMAPARRVTAARSPELRETVAKLRTRFDYLVLDAPAILATSDAIALAGLTDACCLVVRQGVTPAATAQEALAAIRHLNVAGVILNQVRVHMPAGLAGQLTQG